MSREAFGDPPESQEPPDLCPVCGNDWHAEDCEFGKEVMRRLKAERDAHRLAVEERTLRLRYGVVSGWIVRALKVLDTLDPDDSAEADELRKLIAAGEVLALTTLANSKTPNKPLRRGVDGVCTRSTCECEREGLGDQCVWLKPAEAEFECMGEPSLCANPRGCACVPDSKTPNADLSGRTRSA